MTIRLVNRVFQDQYDPTIEDCFRTSRNIMGKEVVFDVLDTAGQDEFVSIKQQYMVLGKVFLIVYSITSRQSFEECQSAVELLLKTRSDQAIWALVGNKVDLDSERVITTEEGEKYAKEKGAIGLIETSAKNNLNIDKAFITVIEQFLKLKEERKSASRASEDKKGGKKGCLLL